MGSNCTRLSPKPGGISLAGRLESQENEPMRCNETLHLEIRLQNLRLSNLLDVVEKITFQIEDRFRVTFPKSDFQVHEKTIKWNTAHTGTLQILGEELERKKMKIQIYDNKNKVVQKLSFKLLQLCTGPSHQDHLLQEMKARLAFDIKITQLMIVKLALENMEIRFFQNGQEDLSQFGYSMSLAGGQDQHVYETGTHFYQQGWKPSQLNFQILSHNLRQSTIRIQIWKKEDHKKHEEHCMIDHYADIYIPYMRMMTEMYSTVTENGKEIEKRKIDFQEHISIGGINKMKCNFSLLSNTSRLFVEQMQCLILTENGIGTISPHEISCQQKASVEINELKVELEKLKNLEEYTSKDKTTIRKALTRIHEMTKLDCKVSYTSNEELYQFQILLIEIMEKAAKMLTGGEQIINQTLWRSINTIIHRPQLSIRYLVMHFNDKLKNEVGCRFYCFICLLMEKIIHSTTIGVTYHELECIQKFIGYAYFRLPWLQNTIIKTLERPNDPHINHDKLIQLGACLSVKSPSKSVVYDWDKSVFSAIKNNQQFKKAMNNLEQLNYEIPDWAKILFSRHDDELLYGQLIEIWNEAEITLKYQDHIKWEYFPYYGELLSVFLGEMNKNPISEYSPKFQDCSMKLVSNEKLLNSFMTLIFAKTCLYEPYSVMRCLDLLKGYFQVITIKKKVLPKDFDSKYFETAVKSLVDSNHSYLLVKVLSLIYDYYHLFSNEFKMTFHTYILGKPFYCLFLHWCGHVRKIFYYLLKYRIRTSIQTNPEDPSQFNLTNPNERELYYKYQNLINNLQQMESLILEQDKTFVHLKTADYHVYMKEKLKHKKLRRKSIFEKKREIIRQSLGQIESRRKGSQMPELKLYRVRKWSVSSDGSSPDDIPHQQRKYVLRSMKQFKSVNEESNPNGKVESIQKMFSAGGEGGLSIDR